MKNLAAQKKIAAWASLLRLGEKPDGRIATAGCTRGFSVFFVDYFFKMESSKGLFFFYFSVFPKSFFCVFGITLCLLESSKGF